MATLVAPTLPRRARRDVAGGLGDACSIDGTMLREAPHLAALAVQIHCGVHNTRLPLTRACR